MRFERETENSRRLRKRAKPLSPGRRYERGRTSAVPVEAGRSMPTPLISESFRRRRWSGMHHERTQTREGADTAHDGGAEIDMVAKSVDDGAEGGEVEIETTLRTVAAKLSACAAIASWLDW